jgi:alkane 1-monooxygenase
MHNKVVSFTVGVIVYMIVVYLICGKRTFYFHLLYSFFTVWNLEQVNYLEHYGLVRKKDKDGIYEAINIKHSWNVPNVFGNYALFKL